MKRALAVLSALLALFATGVAAAPTPDDAPRVELVRDAGPGSAVPAGVPVTFTWVLFDRDGRPFPHHDAVFEATLNGRTLVRTTPSSGHDYDGVDTYRVVFPEPGRFTVRVAVLARGDGPLGAVHGSDASQREVLAEDRVTGLVRPGPAAGAAIDLELPDDPVAGQAGKLTWALTGPAGEVVRGTDAVLRVRHLTTGLEVLAVPTHAADGRHDVTYAFPQPGPHEVVVSAWRAGEMDGSPAGRAAHRRVVDVAPGGPRPPETPSRMYDNVVHDGEADGDRQLFSTYDPYTAIGPYGRIRLGTVAVDGEGRPADPAGAEVRIEGPDGTVLATPDLGGAPSARVVALAPGRVGDYAMTTGLSGPGWNGTTSHRFSVRPPDYPAGAGPYYVDVQGLEDPKAGPTGRVTAGLTNPAGVPMIHGELDLRLADGTGVPLVAGKLHAHTNGTFPVDLAFPDAGRYDLDLYPTPTLATPTPVYYGEMTGQVPSFVVEVQDGPGLPADDPGGPAEETRPPAAGSTETVPGPGALAALVGLAASGVLLRVRRR